MTETATGGITSGGPICPNCRAALREHLRRERIAAPLPEVGEPQPSVTVTYCGSCGWTLAVVAPPFMPGGGPRPPGSIGVAPGRRAAVGDPPEPGTREGQFQLRCRELVGEIQALGFTPGGWIALINELGALGAARHVLAGRHVLPVTRWLIEQGHLELTMEHEIGEARWSALFNDEERTTAARRLGSSGS